MGVRVDKFVFLGLVSGELEDPLNHRGRGAALTLAALYSLALPLPTIFHNLRFSKEYESAWVLQIAPLENFARFTGGLAKAVVYKFMLPALLLMGAVFFLRWQNPLHALLHFIAAVLVVAIANQACAMIQLRRIPFSEPAGRGESFGAVAPMMAAVSFVAGFLAAIHFVAAVSLWGLLGYLGCLALALAILTYIRSIRIPRDAKSDRHVNSEVA